MHSKLWRNLRIGLSISSFFRSAFGAPLPYSADWHYSMIELNLAVEISKCVYKCLFLVSIYDVYDGKMSWNPWNRSDFQAFSSTKFKKIWGLRPSTPLVGLQRPKTPSCLGALRRFAASAARIIGVHGVWNVYCLLKLGCTVKKENIHTGADTGTWLTKLFTPYCP